MTIEQFAGSLRSSSRDGKLIKPDSIVGDYLIDTEAQARWTFNREKAHSGSA